MGTARRRSEDTVVPGGTAATIRAEGWVSTLTRERSLTQPPSGLAPCATVVLAADASVARHPANATAAPRPAVRPTTLNDTLPSQPDRVVADGPRRARDFRGTGGVGI